jgi:hypothetical protein
MAGLLVLAVALLEAERVWTRGRRRRGRHVGAPAYMLDALAIVSAVLAAAGALALVARGILSAALLAGGLLIWVASQARPYSWLLITIAAIIAAGTAGVRLARARLRASHRHPELSEQSATATGPVESDQAGLAIVRPPTPQPLGQPVSPTSRLPALAASSALAQASAAPAGSPPRIITAQIDEPTETLASLSTIGHSRRSYTPSAPQPQSFLTSAPEVEKRRPRARLALAALALIVVGSGGFAFRQPIAGLLPALRPATGEDIATAPRLPTPNPALSGTATLAPALPTIPALVSRRVRSDTLNLRVGPGTDQQVIAKLTRGASVVLLGEAASVDGRMWVRVRVAEQEGWVSQDLLE